MVLLRALPIPRVDLVEITFATNVTASQTARNAGNTIPSIR